MKKKNLQELYDGIHELLKQCDKSEIAKCAIVNAVVVELETSMGTAKVFIEDDEEPEDVVPNRTDIKVGKCIQVGETDKQKNTRFNMMYI